MTPTASTEPACCSVVELRQYAMRPGRRDALIELFDSELVEPQEEVGAHIVGQFRDLDDQDRFVWLRGFADMAARDRALRAFYGGPVWAAHRERANATMADSDDVLLLRPAWPGAGFRHPLPPRPGGRGRGDEGGGSTFVAWVLPLAGQPADSDVRGAIDEWAAELGDAGFVPLAWLRTEPAANTFPALPVREGEDVLVCLARAPDDVGGTGPPEPDGRVSALLAGQPVLRRIAPTARSQLASPAAVPAQGLGWMSPEEEQ
jgi:hypothetical protein